MQLKSRPFRVLLATAATALAGAFAASPANAGVLLNTVSQCDNGAGTQVFSAWGDSTNYFLAPGGDFENGAPGWSINGSSSIVEGNESFNVTGSGSSSAAIPSGSSVTSPTICVGLEHPSMRFFVKKNSGGPLALLNVAVQLEDVDGNVITVPVGLVSGSSSWAPSSQVYVVANLLALIHGEYTPIRLKFTALSGNWQIDDVHVDPWRCC